MKLSFLSLFLACAVLFAAGSGNVSSWQSFGGFDGEAPVFTVLESDQTHMLINVSLPGFRLNQRPEEGQVWSVLELPGCYPQGDPGLPALPSVTRLFAMPLGAEATVTVESVASTVYDNMQVLPRQRDEIDMDHPRFPFAISEEYYSSGSLYPEDFASIDNQGIWSGLNMGRLLVNPFRYNAATGELEAANSVTVRVDFQGGTRLADPVNEALVPSMEENVVNWDIFENAATAGSRDDGVEYVFVCTTENYDWVSDLVEAHHYLGLHTRVETLSAPATTDAIKTAIVDNYTTGVTRFACIVGTNDELPSYVWSGYVGDYWYGCINGAPDVYAELGIGRLTGDQSQIENQVTKIMTGYMDYDFDDTPTTGIIPSEAILAAHGEQYPGKYTQCMNELAAYSYSLMNFAFTKVFPPEGGTASMVSEGMNNEIGTVTYRGHGDVTYWTWSPGWNATNINALTNTFMPPVFNIACLCGDYTPSSTCLAEAWQWATAGCSGNLSATDPSYTYPNHDYIKEIYKEIYDYGNYRITEAINASTVTTIGIHGDIGIANAKMYIWFGDPAQNIWTFDTAGEPGELMISAPANVSPGTQDITITVTDDGTPVEGVTVTLTDGVDMGTDAMTCYERGTTNASGQATINVTVPASGTMHVGAFMQDYRYDMADIPIYGTWIEGPEVQAGTLLLSRPTPNPVVSNASLGFSVPASGNVSISVYDVSGRQVETILDDAVEAGSHSLEWTPGSSISSGVYFIKLTTDSGSITQQAMVIR